MPDCNWYDSFYAAVEKSPAYSQYCQKVFGRDFSQQGFSNVEQIDRMLRALDIQNTDIVLDMGCGNGKMIEYISDVTGARGIGFDFSPVAIRAARERTRKKTRLRFDLGCIGIQQYEENSLNIVTSVDTVFFGENLARTIGDIFRWLKPGGKGAIFYSSFRFDTNVPLDSLQPDGTDVARAMQAQSIPYCVYDFTQSHYEHMRLKKQVISSMKDAFLREGSMLLYENALTESIEGTVSLEEFIRFSTRYLYIIKK